MKNNAQNLKKRPITSIFAFISFIYLVSSGTLVHFSVSEHGLEQLKDVTVDIHLASAGIFLISVIIHIVWNWKVMKQYMFSEFKNILVFRKEFVIPLFLVTILVILAGTHEFLS
jgi:hypothetical protein